VEYLKKGEATGCVAGKSSYGVTSFCTKTGQELDAAASFSKADYPSKKTGKSTNANFSKTYPIGSTISITDDGESPKVGTTIARILVRLKVST
jgi:hypothetical protein